jgi:hypothetical protein
VPSHVIRAVDLSLLGRLPPDYPRPVAEEWFNRRTRRPLRATTISMIKRTLGRSSTLSDSVRKVHVDAVVRLVFETEQDRSTFAEWFYAIKLLDLDLTRRAEP